MNNCSNIVIKIYGGRKMGTNLQMDKKTEEKVEAKKRKEQFELEGLNCSNCALKIEDEVTKIEGLDNVKLNFATSTIDVEGDENLLEDVEKEIQSISNRIEPGVKVKKRNKGKNQKSNSLEENKDSLLNDFLSKNWKIVLGCIFFAAALVTGYIDLINFSRPDLISLFFFVTAYFLIGWPVINAALKNIGRGQIFDENFLMLIATVGAFSIREYPEAVAVMLFYMIGELFQDRAVNQSRRSIKDLMNIRADYANVVVDDSIIQVNPEDIEPGDHIVIKPGEKVPLDGKIISGSSSMDTSALTGESYPRSAEIGDEVLSGMVNLKGLLKVKVTKEYSDSTVKKILDLVENASSKKASTEKFITKFSRYYTPFVVFSALMVAVIPPLFLGGSFSEWFYRSLIFLVVSCPCALVVSIPLGFFGGIGLASKKGILVKGGNFLEALNNVDKVVFDKTGTLTKGSFSVVDIIPADGYNKKYILKTAAEAEQFSNHPIAKSILDAYGEKENLLNDAEFEEISGAGIKAEFDNKIVMAGNEKLMNQFSIDFKEVLEEGTVIYLAENDQFIGHILINDVLKEDAEKTVKELKSMNIKVSMLSGDRKLAAAQIAEKLSLDSYYSELLPGEKVKKIEELLDNKGKLIFVGDGINDAPVLARSDIGVAMGALGSDAAIEAADIVLMTDEPSKILTAVNIARKTKKIVWQNIYMALGVKGIVMILGAFGSATMWEAVFADVGVALLAVFNVMRILKSD